MAETPGATFARRLREVRQAKDMTQAELARRLTDLLDVRIDGAVITKIEKGDRGVRLEEAVYSAEILDVPLESLVTGIDPIDARIAELQRQIEGQGDRANVAMHEYEQATSAVAHLQQEIDRLETSCGD